MGAQRRRGWRLSRAAGAALAEHDTPTAERFMGEVSLDSPAIAICYGCVDGRRSRAATIAMPRNCSPRRSRPSPRLLVRARRAVRRQGQTGAILDRRVLVSGVPPECTEHGLRRLTSHAHDAAGCRAPCSAGEAFGSKPATPQSPAPTPQPAPAPTGAPPEGTAPQPPPEAERATPDPA